MSSNHASSLLLATASVVFLAYIGAAEGSIVIDTPAQYEKLRIGAIGTPNSRIIIQAGAHPDILSQPKYFWAAPYESLIFLDEHQSFVSISPRQRSVDALFLHGSNLTLGFPHQYTDYSVNFGAGTGASKADIDYLFEWKDVINLHITGGHHLPQQVTESFQRFFNLKQLRSISIDIQRESYLSFRVPFLLYAPALRVATFNAHGIEASEFEIFVANQNIPPKLRFNCRVVENNKYECRKRLFLGHDAAGALGHDETVVE